MPSELAFSCDAEDHCETSAVAYKDVKPLLMRLCKQLGKSPADLRIYDPYFCAGGTTQHLQDLGFPNVYNKCSPCFHCQAFCFCIPAMPS